MSLQLKKAKGFITAQIMERTRMVSAVMAVTAFMRYSTVQRDMSISHQYEYN